MGLAFFIGLVAIVNNFVHAQPSTWILSSPAHIVKVESEVGGTVSGSLNWEGEGANLSLCLLKRGFDLNSQNCQQRFSVVSGNTLLFSYIASVKSQFFLRVDPNTFGSSDIKYIIKYSSQNPEFSASKTMGFSLDSPHDIITYLSAELSSGYHYTLASAQSIGSEFETKLKSPGGAVTFFTAVNGEQKCFVNIDKEVGEWYIQIKNRTRSPGLVYDITEISLETAKDPRCQQNYRLGNAPISNPNAIIGGSIGGAACCCISFICLFCGKR